MIQLRALNGTGGRGEYFQVMIHLRALNDTSKGGEDDYLDCQVMIQLRALNNTGGGEDDSLHGLMMIPVANLVR